MFGPYAKAIAATLTSAALLLLTFLGAEETFTDINTREWVQIAIELLAIGGVVYAVPNAKVDPPATVVVETTEESAP